MFIETKLQNWDAIHTLDSYFKAALAFRGQGDADWGLTTSLERIVHRIRNGRVGYSPDSYTEEKWMVHDFQRKYPLYSHRYPPFEDTFEWLAIMQHYGAPTRLLDFTESIYVAAYFALSEANADCAIWAINRFKIRNRLHDRFSLDYHRGEALLDEVNIKHIEFANTFLLRPYTEKQGKEPMAVIPVVPRIFFERLSKQQGLFLMPTNGVSGFIKNLAASFDREDVTFEYWDFDKLKDYSIEKNVTHDVLALKIRIPKSLVRVGLASLCEMNVTAESLFPGIDGMARSMTQLHIK